MVVFRVALRGDILARDRDLMDRLYWLGKWFFLAGGFVGAAEKAAAEAAAGAGAYGGTGDSVDADVDTEGFVSFSTKQRTYICNVLF